MTTSLGTERAERAPRLGLLALLAVVARPWLWRDALAVALGIAVRRWWRRRPHLPVPDRRYLRWRMQTAYGGDGSAASSRERARDLVSFLEFRRSLRHDR